MRSQRDEDCLPRRARVPPPPAPTPRRGSRLSCQLASRQLAGIDPSLRSLARLCLIRWARGAPRRPGQSPLATVHACVFEPTFASSPRQADDQRPSCRPAGTRHGRLAAGRAPTEPSRHSCCRKRALKDEGHRAAGGSRVRRPAGHAGPRLLHDCPAPGAAGKRHSHRVRATRRCVRRPRVQRETETARCAHTRSPLLFLLAQARDPARSGGPASAWWTRTRRARG